MEPTFQDPAYLAGVLDALRERKTKDQHYEVRLMDSLGGESVVYARNVYATSGGITYNGPSGYHPVGAKRVRSIGLIDAETIAKQYREGNWVNVQKYGNTYSGKITKVARTRVTVVFRTIGGKTKTTTVPAVDVRLGGRGA